MEKSRLEKIVNKKNIKEANGLDISTEEVQILTAFMEMCDELPNDEEDMSKELKDYLSKNPVYSPIPYIICKEHAPLYFELYQDVKSQFELVYAEKIIHPSFRKAFDMYDEFFCCYYGNKLLTYADWAEEEKLEGLCLDDIPEYNRNKDNYEQIKELFQWLDRINEHLIPMLETYNRGQCMCFYPLVHNVLSKISYILDFV